MHMGCSEVQLVRNYNFGAEDGMNGMVDAFVDHLILEGSPSPNLTTSNGRLVLQEAEGLCVDGVRVGVQTSADTNVATLTLRSTERDSRQIMELLQRVHCEADDLQVGELCFFQQKMVPNKYPAHRSVDEQVVKFSAAPRTLSFDKTLLHTSKAFSNLYGHHVKTVANRVDFFTKGRQWYDERGIPYQLGMLFTGDPGCGKSSTVRAIAKHTRRHIVSVSLADILTATQLDNLFFSDTLDLVTGDKVKRVKVPIEKRLYVIEEVDAAGGVVLSDSRGKAVQEGQLTLRDILDVLDGNREMPGRMLVMTANHPEHLDPAFIRPGRVDFTIKYGPVTQAMLQDMFECFFGHKPETQLPGERILSPAEVSEVYFSGVISEWSEDKVSAALLELSGRKG